MGHRHRACLIWDEDWISGFVKFSNVVNRWFGTRGPLEVPKGPGASTYERPFIGCSMAEGYYLRMRSSELVEMSLFISLEWFSASHSATRSTSAAL